MQAIAHRKRVRQRRRLFLLVFLVTLVVATCAQATGDGGGVFGPWF